MYTDEQYDVIRDIALQIMKDKPEIDPIDLNDYCDEFLDIFNKAKEHVLIGKVLTECSYESSDFEKLNTFKYYMVSIGFFNIGEDFISELWQCVIKYNPNYSIIIKEMSEDEYNKYKNN